MSFRRQCPPADEPPSPCPRENRGDRAMSNSTCQNEPHADRVIIAAPDRNRDGLQAVAGGPMPLRFDARILLVEDDEVNLDLATRLLERMGCRVVSSSDGASAVAVATRNSFDLIFMDCELPVLDGYEATKRVREFEASAIGQPQPRVPIVALTAHSWSEARHQCLAAGMDDIVTKPIDKAELIERLRRWLPSHTFDGIADVTGPETSGVIDMRQIADIRALDEKNGLSLLARTIKQFESTASSLVATIRAKLGAGDAEALWRAAHALKSSAGALGAHRVARCCREMEASARASNLLPAHRLMQSLEAEIASALGALRELVGATS